MNNKGSLDGKSKRLAYLLRHDANALESAKIDEHGWRSVEELLNLGFTKTILEEIVLTNNKKRYEFNDNKTKIRARQGHSIQVDVELERKSPPTCLYHGTTETVKALILKDGIKSMSRLYVHLSEDIGTAMKVGRRHGENVAVLQIDAGKMEADGFVFHLSKNNVWLTEYVEPKYIHI